MPFSRQINLGFSGVVTNIWWAVNSNLNGISTILARLNEISMETVFSRGSTDNVLRTRRFTMMFRALILIEEWDYHEFSLIFLRLFQFFEVSPIFSIFSNFSIFLKFFQLFSIFFGILSPYGSILGWYVHFLVVLYFEKNFVTSCLHRSNFCAKKPFFPFFFHFYHFFFSVE